MLVPVAIHVKSCSAIYLPSSPPYDTVALNSSSILYSAFIRLAISCFVGAPYGAVGVILIPKSVQAFSPDHTYPSLRQKYIVSISESMSWFIKSSHFMPSDLTNFFSLVSVQNLLAQKTILSTYTSLPPTVVVFQYALNI